MYVSSLTFSVPHTYHIHTNNGLFSYLYDTLAHTHIYIHTHTHTHTESGMSTIMQIPGFVPTPDGSSTKIQPLVRGYVGAYRDNQRHGYGRALLFDG